MATCSSILAWRIPWTEKAGRLQSIGSQRVRHELATGHTRAHTHWEVIFLVHAFIETNFPSAAGFSSTVAPISPTLKENGDTGQWLRMNTYICQVASVVTDSL